MKLRLLLFLLSGLVAIPGAQAQTQTETEDRLAKEIPNYLRPADGKVAYAGQPSEDGFQAVKDAGFKTVINLRPADEMSFDEKKVVEGLGMAYVNIPITTFSITEEKVGQLADLLGDPDAAPVLFHCGSSNRVGGMWYIYRVLFEEASEEEAMEEAVEYGLRNATLTTVVKEYVSERK